jgi:hypothetical protein
VLSALLVSCASAAPAPVGDGGVTVTVDNPTAFNVYFERGQRVGRHSKGAVSLSIEDATLSGGFDILYEIPLSAAAPLFCKGDHVTIREGQQQLTIKEPRFIENYGAYIVMRNSAGSAVSVYSGGTAHPGLEQRGSPVSGNHLARTDKREFSPGETAVFSIGSDFGNNSHGSNSHGYYIRDGRANVPLVLPKTIETNSVYTVAYTAAGAQCVDARPLHRMGEAGWVTTIDDAAGPVVLAGSVDSKGTGISLFAPTKAGLIRRDFDSAGGGARIAGGDGFEVTVAIRGGGGFFVVGYKTTGSGGSRPVARLLGADGVLRGATSPGSRVQWAYYLTAVCRDGEWLAAGAAQETAALDYAAYVRLFRDTGGVLAAAWELAGNDFNGNSPGTRCGAVRSAAYDAAHGRWLLTGESVSAETGMAAGAYVAVIDGNGKIQTIDAAFTGMSFNSIVIDETGTGYLAGEEQRDGETYAALIAYNAGSGQFRRISTPPPAHSFYQDAVLDAANRRLALGGVLRARAGGGQGGVPFIESVDLEKGELLWREELSGPAFAGTALVTGILPAPDYGYALALSGIVIDRGGNPGLGKPFVIARVNARGTLYQGAYEE